MGSRKEDLRVKEIPDVVIDPQNNRRYMKGKFLGKVIALNAVHMVPFGHTYESVLIKISIHSLFSYLTLDFGSQRCAI